MGAFWTNLGAGILAIFGSTAAALTSRWAMRVAAVTIGFTLFFGLASLSWDIVVNQFGVAALNATSAMGNADAAMAVQTFRCLMPASTAAALTVVMTSFIQAVILIWTRRIIMMKMAG